MELKQKEEEQPDKQDSSKSAFERSRKKPPPSEVLYTRGTCSNIKGMFEENIAVKKGLKPDPSLERPQSKKRPPEVVSNVRGNAENLLRQFQSQGPPPTEAKAKEYIPIDKKIFNQFLNKFEDEKARQGARNQLYKMTASQKKYASKTAASWTEREEEKKRREMEEAEARELEEQRQMEEEIKRIEEEENERRALEEAAAEAERMRLEAELVAAQDAKPKKKKKKKKKENLSDNQTQLPSIVTTTCSDLMRKFDTRKYPQQNQLEPQDFQKVSRPRRLIPNPFERKT